MVLTITHLVVFLMNWSWPEKWSLNNTFKDQCALMTLIIQWPKAWNLALSFLTVWEWRFVLGVVLRPNLCFKTLGQPACGKSSHSINCYTVSIGTFPPSFFNGSFSASWGKNKQNITFPSQGKKQLKFSSFLALSFFDYFHLSSFLLRFSLCFLSSDPLCKTFWQMIRK